MPAPENHNMPAAEPLSTETLALFEAIQSELGQVQQRIENLLSEPDEQIRQCLSYLNQKPGKMIRPALVLLGGGCVGAIGPVHIDLAAMMELIHRASLLHDDVIDSARTRRGQETANSLWDNTAAVLLGDFLLSRAFYLGSSVRLDQAAEILSRTARDICCGELRQNFWKGRWDISFEQYYQLIEAKTASLFQSSCCLGAMAAEAPTQQVEQLSRYGHHLGMAFQITDDLLDMLGTSKAAGKTLGTDLTQGKLTLPVIHWVQQEPEKKEARMALLTQGCNPQQLVDEMTQSGSIEFAFSQVHSHLSQAKETLGEFPASPARTSLGMLADYVAGRLK
jgi:octaprenyl-diphosphate synthase